jgi:murein L,D-transpeptidase YcbB/YkuD
MTHDIVLKYLELVFSWPVIITVLIIIFKRHVADALVNIAARITHAEVGGQTFQFGSTLAAESDVVETLEEIHKTNPGILKKAGLKETSFSDYLRSTKNKVGKIQDFLKNRGYYRGKIDGMYGPKTHSAVRRFQEDNDLIADGIVGRETLKRMDEIALRKKC